MVVAHLLERLRVALAIVLLVVLQRVATGVVLVPSVRRGKGSMAVAVRSVGVQVGHAEERAQRVDHLLDREADDDTHHGDERRPRV